MKRNLWFIHPCYAVGVHRPVPSLPPPIPTRDAFGVVFLVGPASSSFGGFGGGSRELKVRLGFLQHSQNPHPATRRQNVRCGPFSPLSLLHQSVFYSVGAALLFCFVAQMLYACLSATGTLWWGSVISVLTTNYLLIVCGARTYYNMDGFVTRLNE